MRYIGKKKDLTREKDHADIKRVAFCPYEAKTVIAEVAVKVLDAMIELHGGIPGRIFTFEDYNADGSIREGLLKKREEEWHKILEDIRDGFIETLDDNHEDNMFYDKVYAAEHRRKMNLFVEWFDSLWI